MATKPFDLHQTLKHHFVERGPQPDLFRIEVTVDGKGFDVRNHYVGAILVHRRDAGIELAEGAVRQKPNHRARLHPENRRPHWCQHRSDLTERLGAREVFEAAGELPGEWLDENAEGLLVVRRPGRTVGRIQIARRRRRQ